jgi:hypothetical protein
MTIDEAIQHVILLTEIAQQHQCFAGNDVEEWEKDGEEVIVLLNKLRTMINSDSTP